MEGLGSRMSCRCNSKLKHKDHVEKPSSILPFHQCELCTFKHLSYSYIGFQNQKKWVSLGHAYLALMHCKNNKDIFNLVLNILNDKVSEQEYESLFDSNLSNEEQVNELTLFELNTSRRQEEIILLSAVTALGRQVGYFKSNKPTIIGLLQRCADLENDEEIKQKIRILWKTAQNDIPFLDEPILIIQSHLLN